VKGRRSRVDSAGKGRLPARVGRVDFYCRKYRTIAEVDGAIKDADPDRARAQLRRDSMLRDDCFEVVHFAWQQITQTPEHVALSITKAFRRSARNAALGASRALLNPVRGSARQQGAQGSADPLF
jgi:hypothetical protein